ncbi:unnamed protein product [Boreogadus saida]
MEDRVDPQQACCGKLKSQCFSFIYQMRSFSSGSGLRQHWLPATAPLVCGSAVLEGVFLRAGGGGGILLHASAYKLPGPSRTAHGSSAGTLPCALNTLPRVENRARSFAGKSPAAFTQG